MTVPRSARRMIVAIVSLAIVDLFVPAVRDRLEVRAYEESNEARRFENSDLFALGPLTQYLREHPASRRSRALFVGNSVMFGYKLNPEDSIPSAYQRLAPETKVFNASINGLDIGSSYLIAKAVIDSVDTVVVLSHDAGHVHPLLDQLIPISEDDRRTFGVVRHPPPLLAGVASQWRLYRDTYRLQAAMLGTSTREYLYLHKGRIVRDAIRRVRGGEVIIDAPVSPSDPVPEVNISVPPGVDSLSTPLNSTIVAFGELFRATRKRLIVLQVRGPASTLNPAEMAAFNARYAPYARVVLVEPSPDAVYDGMHFSKEGATALARQIRRLTTPEPAR